MKKGAFISAVACLAETPKLVTRLFLYDGFKRKNGIFRVKMFKKGLITTVTIDDYLPYKIEDKLPLFSSNLE